jgi:hypothetical protein
MVQDWTLIVKLMHRLELQMVIVTGLLMVIGQYRAKKNNQHSCHDSFWAMFTLIRGSRAS